MTPVSPEMLQQCRDRAANSLLQHRHQNGHWVGELSTSALSTATAVMAVSQAIHWGKPHADHFSALVTNGIEWLIAHQNDDGGWGDTILSHSNISTTMLCHAVLTTVPNRPETDAAIARSGVYIKNAGGVIAVITRYGRDRTFSVPILTHCALAGLVDWKDIPALPFELSCVPARYYAAVRLPVVSYALPALIAIGQLIFARRGHWNPLVRWLRRKAIAPSLKVLERIQPENGGFLEATPLTSFVCMSLIASGQGDHPVVDRCLSFIENSVLADGSWPIDTNLTTWVTTLSVNALAGDAAATSEPLRRIDQHAIETWLLKQQYRSVHPYTNSPPGGWSWTDLPGGVPDADDTPGAMLALIHLQARPTADRTRVQEALQAAAEWLLGIQNRDGGWPTFCRGWGTLPFDRSSNDLSAHVIRALSAWLDQATQLPSQLRRRSERAIDRGLSYLRKNQRADGTWLPLWFGHQDHPREENPLYGTAKVVIALKDTGRLNEPMGRRGVAWLTGSQNRDGGWSARQGLASSTEETALALEALAGIPEAKPCVDQGLRWLCDRVQDGTFEQPAPIGFYFAKLWYFERLYPIIFANAAFQRCCQHETSKTPDTDARP